MKNVSFAVTVAIVLAACGGGGGDSSSAAMTPASTTTPTATVSTTTPPSTTSTTATPAAQTYVAPAPSAGALKLTTSSLNQGGASMNAVVAFTKAVDLTLPGRLNNIWVASSVQPGGTATIGGDLNTIVFMPGVSAEVAVTGSGNIFYVPTGASVTITGSGTASSTIRNYTP